MDDDRRSGDPMSADDDSFDSFYAATYRRMVGQLTLIVGSRSEAEDLAQEAYARALARWPRLQRYDLPEAWVRRVAIRLATDELRRVRRFAKLLIRVPPPEPDPPAVERLEALAAFRRLSMGDRELLVLRFLAGRSIAQISADLAIPPGTVASRLARARRRLEAALADETEESTNA